MSPQWRTGPRDGFAVVPADRLWQGDPVASAD
jgi:hypothetical protein